MKYSEITTENFRFSDLFRPDLDRVSRTSPEINPPVSPFPAEDPPASSSARNGSGELPTGDLKAGPPYPREQRNAVRSMQRRLERLGYSVGIKGEDGKYGPATQRAVKAYKKDFNIQDNDSGRTMSVAELEGLRTARRKDNPSPTGNETDVAGSHSRGSSSSSGRARGEQPGSLQGTSVLALNPDPNEIPNQTIIRALDKAASSLGIQVQITPEGGRRSRQRTQNHPTGEAADIQIVRNGRIIRPSQDRDLYDNLIQALVFNAAKRGVRPGIGGYEWGIHYDESDWRQGRRNSIAGTWGMNFIQRGIQAASREIAAEV